MKKNFNTLNEQMLRMKSLFTEERLYGNLVTESDEPLNKGEEEEDEDNSIGNIEGDGNKVTTSVEMKEQEEEGEPKTDEELKKEGWSENTPTEDIEKYKTTESDTGITYYKLKDDGGNTENPAEDANKLAELKKKYDASLKKITSLTRKDGQTYRKHTGNNDEIKLDDILSGEDYGYEKLMNPTTKKEEIYFIPKVKGSLDKKGKRFGQCKKLVRDLQKDFGKLSTKQEMVDFVKKIKTDDLKDASKNRVKKLQYCIKTNGEKLKNESDILIKVFNSVYGSYEKPKEVDVDVEGQKSKVKEPKWLYPDSSTKMKLVRNSKNKWIVSGKKGHIVARKGRDKKWRLGASLEKEVRREIIKNQGYSSIEELNVINSKRAPKQLTIMVMGVK